MNATNEVPEVTEKAVLTADSGAGGVLQWQKSFAVVITRLVIEVTNGSRNPSTCNFGSAANGGTSSYDLIQDGDTGVVGAFDNFGVVGTNTCLRLAAGRYITGSQSSVSSVAGLTGFAYISYVRS